MKPRKLKAGNPPERMERQEIHESRFEPIRPATRNPAEWARRSTGRIARRIKTA